MLISSDYQKQQEALHDAGDYGGMGVPYAPLVAQVLNKLEVTHLLDYGCGSRLSLARTLTDKKLIKHGFKYQAYDPGVPKYAGRPVPAEMVACIDVLEHVEEDSIDEVLDDLMRLTEAVGFFSVDTGPALKTLPDGRNAHVLQRPPEWWLPRFMARFDLQTYQVTYRKDEHWKFYVIVYAQPHLIDA